MLMPSQKTILVLAASSYQIPVIQAAQELGYRVITADNQPRNPGHRLADKSFNIDIKDKDAILRIARQESIDGIVAAATDAGVPTAAYVSEELNLSGVPFHSTNTVCDKAQFRSFLSRSGLSVPKSRLISADDDLDFSWNGRWIIKPLRSSGCKGVFIVDSETELRRRIPETRAHTSDGTFLFEEFVTGQQFTCEGFLRDGAPFFWSILDRQTMTAPYATTCGHNLPSRLPEALQLKVVDQLANLLAELEIYNGPFDCDFVVTQEELVFLLEMSPRIGGNSIAKLLKTATGFDIVKASIKLACNDRFATNQWYDVRPAAVVLLGVDREGALEFSTNELERLRREEWVDSLTIDVAAGTDVSPFKNGRCRLGEAIVLAADRQELDQRVGELRRRLNFRAV